MACTYLELTISSIDIAAATSNSNVYPFLDNTVFVDYYDCYGNVVTEPFTVQVLILRQLVPIISYMAIHTFIIIIVTQSLVRLIVQKHLVSLVFLLHHHQRKLRLKPQLKLRLKHRRGVFIFRNLIIVQLTVLMLVIH